LKLSRRHLAEYHLIHSARADLLRRLGRISDARAWYETALSLAQQESARKFLRRRLAELQDSAIA
jgi:RNA polymerase sigma-70 factor (ECF subfamily)